MYTAKDIRNLALLGHGGDGKSALCESMLYVTKAITRLGKRADGTTVSDFDDEEKKRQYSIKTSVIPVEFGGCKLNVLDNPGYFDFAAEIVQSLRVADAGLICLTAKSGIAVGTEKGWKSLADAGLPAMFYVSKLDEEHANFFIPRLSSKFSRSRAVPLADRVVIKTVEVEETTKGGLILTGSAKEKPQVAQVVAVGPGGVVDGKEVKMTVKVGDKVLTSKYSGTEVKVDGEECTIVRQADILAIVE